MCVMTRERIPWIKVNRILDELFGYLRIRVYGKGKERLLNICASRGILLWMLEETQETYELNIRLRDFRLLRSIVKKTNVKVVILQRNGLPFFIKRIREKWMFVLGIFLAVGIWLGSTQYLWNIEYSGNQKVTEDQLRDFLMERGIHEGTFIKHVNLSELEFELYDAFPEISWNCMQMLGTTLRLSIKEKIVDDPLELEGSNIGSNMISAYDAIITEMIVRSGVPKVKIGDQVSEDQVLVEGRYPVMNEDGSVKEWIMTKPDADIWLERKMAYEDCESLYYYENLCSERKRTEFVLWKNGRDLYINRIKRFYQEFVVTEDITPKFLSFLDIPVKIRKKDHFESSKILKKRSEEEAKEQIQRKLSRFLSTLEEKGVQIIEKDVKITIRGNFCYLQGEITLREQSYYFHGTEDEFDGTK